MEPEDRQQYLRTLPAVDELLRHPQSQAHLKIHSKELVVQSIRRVLERKRQAILRSADEGEANSVEMSPDHLLTAIREELDAAQSPSLRPVINATGVVLHTNLGRAPLSARALRSIVDVARGYSNLELDLSTGERGSRYSHVEEILCRVSGAESALVVNNNAGGVLLALNSIAEGKEVIVSRGQLVEIGGSFRIPDVMRKSGACLVEVGTTNRTHLEDYVTAMGERSALLLKVHTSNFRILGFRAEVSLKELVALGRARGIPVMEDLGSGCFVDLSQYGLEKEPTVQETIEAGADLVTFSGDKLLGGPQAGIILGKKKYLEVLKKNPLNRALRIDKLTLAGMEATLREYLNGAEAVKNLPGFRMLFCSRQELKRRGKRLQRNLIKEISSLCQVDLKEETSQVGGGALPLQALPTMVVALRPLRISAANLEAKLRRGDPPVISRIKEEEVLLDLRTVAESEEKALFAGVRQALK
jgi:L-seryl-tRNA(Ser) seleniumtransferase